MNVKKAPRTLKRCTNQSLPEFSRLQSDKMSKMLGDHAVVVAPWLVQREVSLRIELIEGFELYRDSRIELGRRLFNYRALFKPQLTWTKLAEMLGCLIGRSSRTIFRLIDEYEESVNGKKPRKVPVVDSCSDGSEDGSPTELSKEEVNFLEARRLIREAVAPWEGSRRIAVLKQAIQEEALASWGMEVHEHFTLEIAPCLPLIMIMGEEVAEGEPAAA